MSDVFDIVVCGAGLVGATASLALARSGYSVLLVEAFEIQQGFDNSQEFDLRVSAITPASRQLMMQLGIWGQVAATRYCEYQRMEVWHSGGQARMSFDAADSMQSGLGYIVENRLLLGSILQQIENESRIEICCPEKIESLDLNNAEKLRFTLISGRQIEASLLIAADGRLSAMRKLAGISSIGQNYHQSAIVANVVTSLPHQNTAWQKFLATGPLAFLPLSNGQSSIVWSCDESYAEEILALTDDEFAQNLAQQIDFQFGEVSWVSKRLSFPLNWHLAEQWLKGRVLLIGDAAHGVHPLAGQGVNLGFADVINLLEQIGECRDPYQFKRLRRYERKRKSEAATALSLFTVLKLFYGIDVKPVNQFRDFGMRLVNRSLPLKRRLMTQAMNNMV